MNIKAEFKKLTALSLAAAFTVITMSSDAEARDRDKDYKRYSNKSHKAYVQKRNDRRKYTNNRVQDLRQRYLSDGRLSRKERARLQQLRYRNNNNWNNRYRNNWNNRYNNSWNNNWNRRTSYNNPYYNQRSTSVLGRFLGYGR